MTNTTVDGSGVSIRSTVEKTVATLVLALGSYVRSIENFTSSEVSGSPLWNRTFGRSFSSQRRSWTFHSVASIGRIID